MPLDKKLFMPFQLGDIKLKNRMVMAPLTRCRAHPQTDAPLEHHAKHYAARSSAGLIISEATQIMPEGKGYSQTPGIYTSAQLQGWKTVTDAVHEQGGVIFAQLWHVGRISVRYFQPHHAAPMAPSAIMAQNAHIFGDDGQFHPVDRPQAMSLADIKRTILAYQKAAEQAMKAGFDGVEIHAANGYLIHQFLSDVSNQRTDQYGGSVSNRLRFAFDVLSAITTVVPSNRVGIRISPVSAKSDALDSAPEHIYFPLISALNDFKCAYVHVIEGETGGDRSLKGFDFQKLRQAFQGAWMVNNGYTREMAIQAVESGEADLVSFGRPFIANPDLVERFKASWPLSQANRAQFYGGNEVGYNDYPIYQEIR